MIEWLSYIRETAYIENNDETQMNTLALIHMWLPFKHMEHVDGQTLTTVEETHHDTHLHIIQLSNPSLFFPLLTLMKHTLAWGQSMIVPAFLFGDCVVGMLSLGSLTEAHNFFDCE